VRKITILPRGRALGYTMVLPDEDKYSTTRSEMLDRLAYMLGGRAAEELVFHDPTTGAANDIEKATALARAMVTQYGMTERLGAIKFGEGNSEPFVGRDIGHNRNYSEEIAAMVDDEVKTLISGAHQEAFDILVDNRDVLDDLVLQLFEKETLDQSEVAAVFASLRRRDRRPSWTGSPQRVPSDRPPVNPPAGTNGSRPEADQGGVVLAPGEGGDIHGGGGSGGSVPTPGGGEGLGSDAVPPPARPDPDRGEA
jgi:cell division protease FtsH